MIFDRIADFIFPRSCHICQLPLAPSERYICTGCLMHMPRTRYHRQVDNPMERRFAGIVPFQKATGHFFYSRGSDLAVLIQDFKYHKFPGIARHLGSIMGAELMTTGFFSDIDVLMPVPMHFLKQARRGYNQAAEVARGVAEASGLPLVLNLKALRGHRTQTSMTLAQRRDNIKGIFKLRKPEEVNNRSLLLIDDVCTTGATLISAAEAIIAEAPDAKISFLTLGVTF